MAIEKKTRNEIDRKEIKQTRILFSFQNNRRTINNNNNNNKERRKKPKKKQELIGESLNKRNFH